MRLILNNLVNISTITANPIADSNYSVNNIKNVLRKHTFRSTSTDTQEVLGIFDSVSDVNSFIISKHNFSEFVTYQLILYDSSNTPIYTSPVYNIKTYQIASDYWEWGEFNWGTITWGKNKISTRFTDIILWFDNVSSVKSFKLILNVTELPAAINYYEIGTIFIGKYMEPEFDISYNPTISWVENTNQYKPGFGTTQSDDTTVNRGFTFSLMPITEADRITIHRDLTILGLRKPFYISMFPEDISLDKQLDFSGIVKLTKIPKYSSIQCGYFKSNFEVEIT